VEKIVPMNYHVRVYKPIPKSRSLFYIVFYEVHAPDLKHAFIKAYRYFKKTKGKNGFAEI